MPTGIMGFRGGGGADVPFRTLEMVKRRPYTAADLAERRGITGKAVADALHEFVDSGCIQSDTQAGRVFYKPL